MQSDESRTIGFPCRLRDVFNNNPILVFINNLLNRDNLY